MEKINLRDLEVKGIQNHYGHEGELLRQGNLYYKNKKVAIVGDGDWGGPNTLIFTIDSQAVRKEIEDHLSEIAKHIPGDWAGNPDLAIDLLLEIKSMEPDIKRKKKSVLQFADRHGIPTKYYHINSLDVISVSHVKNKLTHEYVNAYYVMQVTIENGKAAYYAHKI